jgi:hypothetical protein
LGLRANSQATNLTAALHEGAYRFLSARKKVELFYPFYSNNL